MWRRGELTDCSFSLIVHARSFLHAMINWRRREDINQEEKGRPKCQEENIDFFSFGPRPNMSVDRTESDRDRQWPIFMDRRSRSGPVDRTSVGLCGTLLSTLEHLHKI